MATNDTQNNASQTLFRFVSLRNPQLTETKALNLGFIHKSSKVTSTFDAVINPGDTALLKFRAMERAAKTFDSTGYQSEREIETGSFAEALKIGRKIAKKEILSSAEEISARNLYNNSAIQNKLGQIWDNLIYQTVTQKNFYVKEALIHILKALHFGYVTDLPVTPELTKVNGDDLKAKALEARVVLPMKFFGDGYEGEGSNPNPNTTGNAFQVNVSKIGDGVINGTALSFATQQQLKDEGNRISELSFLSFEKDSLLQLRSELESIQKSFYNLRAKAYDAALKAYQEDHQAELERYNSKLEDIKAQIAKGGLTQEQIDALYASLDQFKVAPFVFEYKNEINFGDLKEKLSLDSFKLFINIFTKVTTGQKPADGFDFSSITVLTDKTLKLGNIVVSITDEYDTFPEVFEKLEEDLSSTMQSLFNKTPSPEQTYASVGGVLIPVVDSYSSASRIVSRSYYLKTSYEPLSSRMPATVTFYYQAESNAWGAASVQINASTDLGLYEETFSNISVVDNKVALPLLLVDKFGKFIRSLDIKIYFNNGKEASLRLTEIEINKSLTGVLYTEDAKDDEQIENPSDGNTSNPGVFIPKHFGVKRLGIADYLKVEQSVHAYVPGEVSNIENVMASELRHKSSVSRDYSETIDTTSETIETEKISDTSRAERAEMQTEVAKELEKQRSFTGSTHFGYSGGYTLDISAGYANNTAQHDSTRQAVAKSQEITERAMERVLTKVNKERVQKIIREFTETNVHEFDNRGSKTGVPPQHITGVYRWVDKKMKNQVYNYGKRTMFEFMIPEPARLHTLATATSKANTLTQPVDPRASQDKWMMPTPQKATKEQIEYWAGIYNVKLTEQPKSPINLILGQQWEKVDGNGEFRHRTIDIPDNYEASAVKMFYGFERDSRGRSVLYVNNFAGGTAALENWNNSIDSIAYFTPQNVTGSYDFVYRCENIDSVNIAFEITCKLSAAYLQSWFQENFAAIIKAYDEAYAVFLEKQKEFETKAKEEEEKNKEKLSTNNFYRDMESVILKHNCIAYLLQDYGALGVNFTNGAERMQDFSIVLSDDLEQYTALAKFMEQAFEWSIMDYTFYPYYWGNKAKWQEMYLSQSTDQLFRSFLQAGMARVVVTVKPGFEDAVQFFMSTGKIWNGGEVPVIGDPLYMSIVDELRQPTGIAQGKYWITRIPTTLTILQAESVGLSVSADQPLPIFPEDNPENCENPKELETKTSFSKDNIRMEPGDKATTLS
ncbi:hypothetical protein F3J23_09220 [Chryseobacterium sp. Tr-659]|uniref:hypothetical protein n=1 Tax=Chryseobacterium sp. Tr-659 TaxID=2608340 RepID=UPI00141F64AB|nr:hypothetical protein [Chryseobacterium sp. Tr-659]NIF05623.1 hypothetical protein [Chryseobacterium sp. Tr-659]